MGFVFAGTPSGSRCLSGDRITILQTFVIGVIFPLLDHLHLLREVILPWVTVELSIGTPAEPICPRSQLVGNVGIIILLMWLFDIRVRVGALAPQGKVCDGVPICRFHILVLSPKSRELIGIGGDLLGGPMRLQQIFRMRPSEFIPLGQFEPLAVSGLHLQMRSLQPFILLIVIDFVPDRPLLVVAAFVDCLLGESRPNHAQLAEMPPALALLAETFSLLVVSEVVITQLLGSPREDLVLPLDGRLVSLHVVGLVGV